MGDGTRLISNGGGIVHTYRGGGNYRVVASDGSYNRTVSPPCPTNNSGDSGNNNQPPKICSSITVFPSPAKLNTATGKTTFKFNFSNSRLNSSRFNYSWQLFDSGNGQRVASGKSSPNSTITVAGLKATTYELRVQCPTRKWEGRRFYVIRD